MATPAEVNYLLDELERMRFECEGGALVNAWAWRQLRALFSAEFVDGEEAAQKK